MAARKVSKARKARVRKARVRKGNHPANPYEHGVDRQGRVHVTAAPRSEADYALEIAKLTEEWLRSLIRNSGAGRAGPG